MQVARALRRYHSPCSLLVATPDGVQKWLLLAMHSHVANKFGQRLDLCRWTRELSSSCLFKIILCQSVWRVKIAKLIAQKRRSAIQVRRRVHQLGSDSCVHR